MFSSPALKMTVKMEGGIVERVEPVSPRRLGGFFFFYVGGHNHKQQISSGSRFGNGSSLSNLLSS